MQQSGDRCIDGVPRRILIIAESGGWVHLEAIPSTVRPLSQIDARDRQTKGGCQRTATVGDFCRWRVRSDLCRRPEMSRVSIIIGRGNYLGREQLVANHMHPIIKPGNVFLELGRTPAQVSQPVGVLRSKLGYDTADAADRFVNHAAVSVPEFPNRGLVACDQGVRNVKTVPLNQAKLIGLGVIALHCRWTIDDKDRGQFDPSQKGLHDAERPSQ